MTLTKYGTKEWRLALTVFPPLILLCAAGGIWVTSAGYAFAALLFFAMSAILFFFRDPERKIPENKKIWLARFDQADETEKELYRTLIARQNKSALGLNAVTLIKEIMRSGHAPERSVLISPEIVE